MVFNIIRSITLRLLQRHAEINVTFQIVVRNKI